MQKRNKILMGAVSLLLCLTLVSSCLVSSIFARYVKTATGSISSAALKKFGVKITTTVDPALASMASKPSVYDTTDEALLEITYSNIKLHPDVSYPEAVKFKVEGSAEVKLALKLYINVSYKTAGGEQNKVAVPEDISKLPSEQVAMPLGYTFGARNSTSNKYVIDNAYAVEPWRFNIASSYIDNALAYRIRDNIQGITAMPCGTGEGKSGASEYAIAYKEFAPGEEIVFKSTDPTKTDKIDEFVFGFEWPFEYASNKLESAYQTCDLDAITMYYDSLMGDNDTTNDPYITVKYTFQILQIQ